MTLCFEKICRTCMAESAELLSIFDKSTTSSVLLPSVKTIKEMLNSLVSLKVINNDGLPRNICLECLNEINRFVRFKHICEQSEKKLRTYVKQLNNSSNTINLNSINAKHSNSADKSNIKEELSDEDSAFLMKNEHEPDIRAEPLPIYIKTSRKRENPSMPYESSNECLNVKFECDLCHKNYPTKRNLRVHMISHSVSFHKCTLCEKQYRRRDQLKVHMRNHSETKKFQCSHCPKGFNVSSSLTKHIRTHTGERPYLCTICGKGFAQSYALDVHIMRHTQTKPFKCEECSFAFVVKQDLIIHMRKHNGERPYVCSICEARFSKSTGLVSHNRVHTGEKPYTCKYCQMQFATQRTMKAHLSTHTDERPFSCEFCNRKFARRRYWVVHQKIHLCKCVDVFKCSIQF